MRTYDVVLFGASGFTGRQTAAYFREHAPAGLRWAIAGRDPQKLESVDAGVDIVVADTRDQPAVDRMVSSTRVLVSTVGPFARFGTPVVDACARLATDYVDITGETFWVKRLIAQYHQRAAESNVRIVPCCGFDSVPSDLGAFIMGMRHRLPMIRSYFQLGGGGLNGGTIASVANMVASNQGREMTSREIMPRPHFDDWVNTWVGPFFMAPTNTWVVRRSEELFNSFGTPYPKDFSYREFLKYDRPGAAFKSIAASTAIGLFGATLLVPSAFRLLQRALPKPGEGPSEERMDAGWFACEVIGRAADGACAARTLIRNSGDAGNRSTVKMLCEAALCLALGERAEVAGVLTPATAFGERLVNRLRVAGMTIETQPT